MVEHVSMEAGFGQRREFFLFSPQSRQIEEAKSRESDNSVTT
jgi:hypothetical protein